MKVVLITGASSGIGYDLARFLSKKNYKVYGLSRSKFDLEGVTYIKCDVTSEEEVKKAILEVYKKENKIDFLINNAGMGISGSIESTELKEVLRMFAVNFNGVFLTTKTVLPYMRKKKYGRIINVGSVAGEFAIPFQTFYSSSKAAIKTFGEALHNEVSPYGISVCTILPGDVKTGFTKNRLKNENELSIYQKRVEKSIGLMEKDEQNGMSVHYASKVIYKVMKRKKMPIVKTIGFKYKLFIFAKRFLPSKFINKLVGFLYAFKKER